MSIKIYKGTDLKIKDKEGNIIYQKDCFYYKINGSVITLYDSDNITFGYKLEDGDSFEVDRKYE